MSMEGTQNTLNRYIYIPLQSRSDWINVALLSITVVFHAEPQL